MGLRREPGAPLPLVTPKARQQPINGSGCAAFRRPQRNPVQRRRVSLAAHPLIGVLPRESRSRTNRRQTLAHVVVSRLEAASFSASSNPGPLNDSSVRPRDPARDSESAVQHSFNKSPRRGEIGRVVPGHSVVAGIECWSEKPEVDGSTPSLTTNPLTWGDCSTRLRACAVLVVTWAPSLRLVTIR